MRKFALLFFALMVSLQCLLAHADSCAKPLHEELSVGRTRTRKWTTFWGTLWSVATVGQATVALATSDPDLKTDLWIGTGGSALGLIPTWILPPAILQPIPECISPSEAEAILEQEAQNSNLNRGWVSHASNLAVNLTISLIEGIAFGHWSAAALSAAAGVPVGEAMILTYPQSASLIREQYKSSFNFPQMAIIPSPQGLTLSASISF